LPEGLAGHGTQDPDAIYVQLSLGYPAPESLVVVSESIQARPFATDEEEPVEISPVSVQEERLERLDLASRCQFTEVLDSFAKGGHRSGFATAGWLVPSDKKRTVRHLGSSPSSKLLIGPRPQCFGPEKTA
jgi:hypothetical protein